MEAALVHQGLAELVAGCESVRACALPWYLFSRLFSRRLEQCNAARECWPLIGHEPPEELREAVRQSFYARVVRLRQDDLLARGGVLPGDPPAATAPLRASRSALVVPAEGEGYAARSDVAPFLKQFACYAGHHGLTFLQDEHTYHPTAFAERFGPEEAFFALAGLNTSWLRQHVRLALGGRLSSVLELARSPTLLATSHLIASREGSLTAWSMPWAIQRHHARFDFVVAIDADMTVRPDAHDVDLVGELLLHSQRRGEQYGHHVYLRDFSPQTAGDCVNSGFVAVRNTGPGQAFLRLWREKFWWAGVFFSDQGCLAESILEFLSMELRAAGRSPVYGSECLPLLFPSADGEPQWSLYCECWQAWLEAQAGPYRRRQSRLVGFVDPQRLDVNFVAHTFFPDRQDGSLDGLRLGMGGPGHPRPLAPFIVHWAGLKKWKLPFMEEYLRRFNLTSPFACPAVPASAGGRAPARDLGSPAIPDAKSRRVVCERILQKGPERRVARPDEFAQWWRGPYGCSRLLGRGPPEA